MGFVQTLEVQPNDIDMRLDRWFSRLYPHINQGQIQKLLRTGQIRVDGKRVEASTRLAPGQMVRIPPLPDAGPKKEKPPISEKDAEALRRMVLYKDDWVIAIDKPAGLAVQGGTGLDKHLDGMLDTLAVDGERPKLVHRLDRETSGVLLLARNRLAAQRMTKNFHDRRTRKYYWAVTIGVPVRHQGKIDAALAKKVAPGSSRRGERMQIDEDEGRSATTLYQVVDHAMKAAWVALWPLTGRTHQLRAHMEAIGTPILGDYKYDTRESEISMAEQPQRLHLHARRIIMPHPSGRGTIDVTSPLPNDLKDTWKYFGFGNSDGDPFADVE
jgi:23S rRNA pseudouridine955/2504/2580 synthase